jgi:hypothetical protein
LKTKVSFVFLQPRDQLVLVFLKPQNIHIVARQEVGGKISQARIKGNYHKGAI